jgi:hypothetical protein
LEFHFGFRSAKGRRGWQDEKFISLFEKRGKNSSGRIGDDEFIFFFVFLGFADEFLLIDLLEAS